MQKKYKNKDVLTYLYRKYPELRITRPLSKNAYVQLLGIERNRLTPNQIARLFVIKQSCFIYQQKIITEKYRYDLFGVPCEEITDKERRKARRQLDLIKEIDAKRKIKQKHFKETERKRLAKIKRREEKVKLEEEKAWKEAELAREKAEKAKKKILSFGRKNQIEVRTIKKRTISKN
ncbi:hypothetical protein VA249_16250 [Vibrio alfacsensis]|uniref:ProQ/FINO family protein n=1 Tax=Vibrio alfacsensis TaxID=1074311 RepID=UPI001BF1382D|nr:ProQ/FINO family protein [Vibrio alfacsensis]BBM64979.1 hypothetical protein VA249_16250 [Vibrio alfacsensis]